MRLLGLMLLAALISSAAAAASPATKIVAYHGLRLTVPATWPVYDLARSATICVRFNRHAVYLGRPGLAERCPAHSYGRTEAILVEPLVHATRAGTGSAVAAPPAAAGGATTEVIRHGAAVFATWDRRPDVIRRALGVHSLRVVAARPAPRLSTPRATRSARAARTRAAATPGAVFTGLGFDACSTPSTSQMTAWDTSPYRAIGVYIGGANMACSQANLTATWVSQEAADGWHVIPIYVSLQAPSNLCGCAGMSSTPSQAASQGTAAALDAVTQAQGVGLGPGNPIYDDMEAYPHTTKNTNAVLAFLNAWTAQLHASGYASGVYSSNASGITDLVAQYGASTFTEPDDLWMATWDGQQNTSDPYVPATEWASHQRINQYGGGHNETYGGVTINVDDDYVDALAAAAGSSSPAPSLSVSPAADGTVTLYPSWRYGPPVSSWELLAGSSATSLTAASAALRAGQSRGIVVHSAFPYFAVEALDETGQVLGTSPAVPTPAHVAMFGNNVFVPARGLAAVPVGCFSTAACHVAATVTIGRTTLATTGREHIPSGAGPLYFSLTSHARQLLASRHGRLRVRITVRDISGMRATRIMTLDSFTTSGRSPTRNATQSPGLQVASMTDFVSHAWVGGILAACTAPNPCRVRATISSGGTVIATTGAQFVGVGELGYVLFTLTPAGHGLLVHARGNQLPVTVSLDDGTDVATAHVVLVSY